MSFASKHTKENPFEFNFTDDTQYWALETKTSKKTGKVTPGLTDTFGMDKIYTIKGLFISNKSKLGPQPSAVIDLDGVDSIVNLPMYMHQEILDIMQDQEDIAAIKAGKVGFKVEAYTNDYGDQLGIKWLDL